MRVVDNRWKTGDRRWITWQLSTWGRFRYENIPELSTGYPPSYPPKRPSYPQAETPKKLRDKVEIAGRRGRREGRRGRPGRWGRRGRVGAAGGVRGGCAKMGNGVRGGCAKMGKAGGEGGSQNGKVCQNGKKIARKGSQNETARGWGVCQNGKTPGKRVSPIKKPEKPRAPSV